MGARDSNNPRTRNRGHVSQFASLDVRDCRKAGCFVEGQLWSRATDDGSRIIVDLQPGREPYLQVELARPTGKKCQTIHLASRPTQFGGKRWYFLDEAGRRCERLFFVGGRFVSRKGGRLTYRSQSLGHLDRLVLRLDKVEARLKGTKAKGPARGKVRKKLGEELARLQASIWIGPVIRLLNSFDAQEELRRFRRTTSKQRLKRARQLMRHRQDVSRKEVLTRFTALVDKLKQKKRKTRARPDPDTLSPVAIEDDERPHVDIGMLARLGYVKAGQLLGDQLGWPEDWLPEPERRLFFLIDARENERACAIFVLQDGEQIEHQFFWLTRVKGLFGRQEYRFICPPGGVLSRKLLYKEGRFVWPTSPGKNEVKTSDPLFDLDIPDLMPVEFDMPDLELVPSDLWPSRRDDAEAPLPGSSSRPSKADQRRRLADKKRRTSNRPPGDRSGGS